MSQIDDLLNHLDLDEQTFHALAADPGVIADTEAYLAKMLPRIDPYLRQGVALGSTALGAAAGGATMGVAATPVALVSALLGNAGISAVERWLASKAPPAPPAADQAPPS